MEYPNSEELGELLDKSLTVREERIIRLRYGLGPGKGLVSERLQTFDHPHTLAEIAAMMGLSRQRVSQIYIRALAKLKKRIERRNNE